MTPEQTLDWLAEQHKSQCNEDRPVQEWIRSMKSMLPAPVQDVPEVSFGNMTKDEALKLALEALEGIHPGNMTPMAEEYWNKAITAIKQARSAPVQEPVGVFVEDDDIGHVRLIPHQQLKLKDGDKLYTTPPAAQPAPVQPVAWRLNGESSLGHGKVFGKWKSGKPPKDVADLASVDKNWSLEFAYTTPPAAQRQWVGLTVDELITLEQKHRRHEDLSRAIEAKLKEKNGM